MKLIYLIRWNGIKRNEIFGKKILTWILNDKLNFLNNDDKNKLQLIKTIFMVINYEIIIDWNYAIF